MADGHGGSREAAANPFAAVAAEAVQSSQAVAWSVTSPLIFI